MFVRELFEAASDTAVFAFGRLNPPTVGHEKLVNTIKSIPGEHYLFLSHTNKKPNEDPLDFDTKLTFAKQFFPDITIGHSSVKTIIQAMQFLEKQGYKKIIYVAGSDRVEKFESLLLNYNGKDYTFDAIKIVNAGERDPDSADVSGMSASKMRKFATDNDFDNFEQGVPNKQYAKELFDAVRAGLKLTTEDELVEAIIDQMKHPTKKQLFWKRDAGYDVISDTKSDDGKIYAIGSSKEIAKKWAGIKDKVDRYNQGKLGESFEDELVETIIDQMEHPTKKQLFWKRDAGYDVISDTKSDDGKIYAIGSSKEIAKKWAGIKDKVSKYNSSISESFEDELSEAIIDQMKHPTKKQLFWKRDAGYDVISDTKSDDGKIYAIGSSKEIAKKWAGIKDKVDRYNQGKLGESVIDKKGNKYWINYKGQHLIAIRENKQHTVQILSSGTRSQIAKKWKLI